MKKIISILMLALIVFVFAVENSRAQQLIVRVPARRPGIVVFRRPHRPSPRHVWVQEEWTPEGTAYVYHQGYWAVPPHPGTVWLAGHWGREGRGYFWIPGHWR
ncbi:MAG: hypothetical protein JWP94_2532 [Mucilaginibacter sp.]|jgi:hypothetical protein|nr:hypothetical protein [Mucilaginibacter sp.]